MARADKAAAVAELTTAFRESTATVLTEYRGLTVAQLKELRRSLAGNATYSVVKNTLSKIAAREAGLAALEPMFEGPSAIAFISGDPVEVAKGLRNFSREHPLLVIKGGVLDGATITAEEIRKLADLESREVLLAKLAGGFIAPATQLVNVLAAPLRQLAQVLGALAAKAEADPSAAGGSDGASATDPQPEPVAEEPVAEEPVAEEPVAEEPVAEEPVAEEPAAAEPAAASDDTTADDTTADSTSAESTTAEPTTDETDGVADASSDS
jgi:large subunit ribosomal protein L10